MSGQKRTAVAMLMAFIAGGLVAAAGMLLAGKPVPQKTQTTIVIDRALGEHGVASFTFIGPGRHTTPDVYGVRVYTTTALIDAPEKEPKSEPLEAREAIDWAFFTLLALGCVAAAGIIVFILAATVGVLWLDADKP